ncbi:uncharacterized protein LOC112966099 isoform X4 [Apteryx rowi]|uniref:uncharacterized protein LOC112966099 isoform X4 n=1 Tax=Apteryx rowi TaxID=308060 RepID=UPI000E1D092B|nr:uncharacterized protein LOC112966099 isoform X4 [Apteryx rowi]XP_025921617.1 uncharacterized protein LOC112966099 isoform X4 [Apteryx rowi]
MNPIVKCTSPAAEKTSIIQITLCCEAENVTKHGNIPKGCPLCASDEVKSATIAKRRLDAHLYHQKRKPECGAPPVQIPRDLPLLTRFLPEVHTYHVTGERFAVATAFRGTEGLQTRCQQGPSTATGRDDLESDRRLVQYHPGSCGGHTGRSCLGGQQEPGAHQNSCDQCPRCWRWTGEGQRFGSDWRCWSRRQCSRQQSPFHCKEEGQS